MILKITIDCSIGEADANTFLKGFSVSDEWQFPIDETYKCEWIVEHAKELAREVRNRLEKSV